MTQPSPRTSSPTRWRNSSSGSSVQPGWWKTPSIEAASRHKLYKLAWDITGTEFAGRHMLYEKFYAGSSIVVRNQSDREAPWQSFHDTVDRLLASIELPKS